MRCSIAALLAAAIICVTGTPAWAGAGEDATAHFRAKSPRDEENPATPITTLTAALRQAYRTNPTLLAQRAKLRAADFGLAQARSAYGPRLTATGSYGYERDNFESSSGGYVPRADWTATAEAILSQPLTTFGRNAAAEHSAQAKIAFNRQALRATEASVLLNTISAYSSLVRDTNGLAIVRDNLALLERENADTASRLRARESTITDFEQVQTRLGVGRAQLLVAQQQLATSRAEFLQIVGALPGELAPADELPMPIVTLEEAYAVAERNNPVLAAAYEREQVSRAAVSSARAEMRPRVDLRGRALSGTIVPYSSAFRETTLRGEVLVSMPIFESGLLRARVDEALEANESDWRLIDAALRDNRFEVAGAWNAMVTQRLAIDQLRNSVDAARRAYDGALQQERAGLRTTLDVLDLARELLQARTSLNRAVSDAYIGQAQLLRAMGSLQAADLLPGNALYAPDVHYADARNNSDIPLLTPLIRALDGGYAPRPTRRPIRDPAGTITSSGAETQTEPLTP